MSELSNLDRGYIEKCAEYGITDKETVLKLMQTTANLVGGMQKQAGIHPTSNEVQMQKQANMNTARNLVDAGFISRCHDRGVTNPSQINQLAKEAALLLKNTARNG